MTPACSNAETGVGASITSVSQPCVGNCADFKSAASVIKIVAETASEDALPFLAAALIAAISVVPNAFVIIIAAVRRLAAPIRVK